MEPPVLFGASYSVYVRIARLALLEKGVPYRLSEVDVFGDPNARNGYADRHPFGRIPAFEHGSFRIYETSAISRYVDEAFPGPNLQPGTATGRARMTQVISILDSYAYRTLVWDIYVERVSKQKDGRIADESVIAAALPKARVCLEALANIDRQAKWLAGDDLTLADLHAAPMFDYFLRALESHALLAEQPRLQHWWQVMSARDSMAATRFP